MYVLIPDKGISYVRSVSMFRSELQGLVIVILIIWDYKKVQSLLTCLLTYLLAYLLLSKIHKRPNPGRVW